MAINPGAGDGDEDDGEEWRFSLEDIERREREQAGPDEAEQSDDEDGGNIAGSFGPSEEIEPGDIDLENALFVLVGVVLAVLAIAGFMNILP